MELVHRTNKASKIASQEEDVIITMPENVITNILNRLPIQVAVGTSILSRKWRFNWTLLTQLVFDFKFFFSLAEKEEEDKDYDWRNIISRLLIHIKRPITKFSLCILFNRNLRVEDINHWVMFLSRNGIKDLTLINWPWAETEFKLPTHLFSCMELKHLKLRKCSFHTPPTFCGFPNLLSLELYQVTDIDNWVEFITKFPLLEILKFSDCQLSIGKVKLADIAKLINLKELCLPLCMLDDLAITSSAIFQLGRYLPKLQELTLEFEDCKFIGEGGDTGARKSVYTIFPCLKTLLLCGMDLNNGSMLSCATEMIWGSANLQKLSIIHRDKNKDDDPPPVLAADNGVGIPPPVFCFPEIDNNTKLQLQSVDFNWFAGSENEVYLIKTILACSPLLRDMTIRTKSSQVFGDDNEKLMFSLKLLELNRASPIAKVKLSF